MFAARCIGISLAIFLLVYVPLSMAVSRGWKLVFRMVAARSASLAADLLFLVRIFPFAVASIFTLAFTLPSFLLLEPRGTDEAVGLAPTILGLCCLVLLAAGIARMASAQLKTRCALKQWLEGSELLERGAAAPVFRTRKSAPSLTVAGVRDPKVLISEATLAALNPAELRTALRHEMAHVRRYDNLKKLVFRFSAFPGMQGLEHQWSEQSELAADDAAVFNSQEALDLASALIKVSRLNCTPRPAVLATGLLHSSTALNVRVQRLFSWRASQQSSKYWWYALPPLAITMLLSAAIYPSALSRLHMATEWLVR